MNSPSPAAAPALCPWRQEITFADGSSVWLWAVSRDGRQQPFERRMPLDQDATRVLPLDLLRLAPDLCYQLPASTTRAAAAAVFHSLRKRFTSAAQFREAVGAVAP